MNSIPRVTVWNEFRRERQSPEVAAIYPSGMHTVIVEAPGGHGLPVREARLDEPEHALAPELLATTDVLIW